MRQSDELRQSDSVVGRGIGAAVMALLAALGRHADDVARFAGRQAGNLERGSFQQADDLGRVVLYGSDDLLRGADDVTRPWTLPDDRMIEPRCIVTPRHAAEPAEDRGGEVLWHLARKTGEETLKLAIEHDKGDE